MMLIRLWIIKDNKMIIKTNLNHAHNCVCVCVCVCVHVYIKKYIFCVHIKFAYRDTMQKILFYY